MNNKKITARFFCLVLTLALLLGGCTTPLPWSGDREFEVNEAVQQRFDEMLEELPSMLLSGDGLGVRFSYREPEKVGIELEPPVLSAATLEEWPEMFDYTRELIEYVESFDPRHLSEQSQLVRRMLLDSLERDLLLEDHFLHFNNNLGSYLGTQAQLPITLAEFPVESEEQLEDYFHLLGTIPDAFAQYLENERLRQAGDVGLSQDMIDLVIEQCENMVSKDHSFLYDIIDGKIDALETMDQAARGEAKARNRQLVEDYVLQAYRDLGVGLGEIEASQVNRGLSEMPGGKEYYAVLLKYEVGVDMTPKQAGDFLEKRFQHTMYELYEVVGEMFATGLADMDLEEAMEAALAGLEQPDEIIAYAVQAMREEYPDAGEMPYTITAVPASMEDNFSPAAYVTPPVDKKDDEADSIYVNYSKYDNRPLYSTIIHESVPGHMYQYSYANRQDLPDAIKLITSKGYTEGWATYVELRSHLFLPEENRLIVAYENVFTKLVEIVSARADLGVHYEGWGEQEVKEYFEESLMIELDDPEAVKEMYLQILETPTNSMYYILTGELFSQMREQAEEQLGRHFSALEFHEVVLGIGSVSMPILQEQVDLYIAERLAELEEEQGSESVGKAA